MPLQVSLFGTPRFARDGEPVPIRRRKAVALLAYLAVTGQPHGRDALATLFWPEHDQSGARANLRRDLSRLRQAMGNETLQVDRVQVGVVPQEIVVDVAEFQVKVAAALRHDHEPHELCPDCVEALETAVVAYSGEFMAGFTLPDSPEFDDWQFFQREGYRQLFGTVLQRLIGWYSSQGAYERGIETGRRWLILDPLHEPAQRQLMQLYAWSGQQAAALRQYHESVRLLDEELGVEPEAETVVLFNAIRARQLEPPPSPSPASTPAVPPVAPPPLNPQAAPDLTPDGAQRFVQRELIATGGHGELYRGHDITNDQPVVIKKLKPDLVTSESEYVTRFQREGEALRQLNHPNIVRMLAMFEADGRHSIVMEYVSGGSLRTLMEEDGQLPLELALDIGLELADALSRAHHLGIIHRDLKPDNVLLAEDHTPRLTDFGVALLEREDSRLTPAGSFIGSPAYMSPEIVRGETPDARSDIWAFGVLLYEMLAGHPPFDGERITTILVSIMGDPVPDILRLRPDMSVALESLLQRMLIKERDGRIPSMRQVAAELEAIRTERFAPTADTLPPPLPARGVRDAQKQSIHYCLTENNVRLAYATVGEGPPLVKAANWLSHLEFDWQSPVWRHWLRSLSRENTLIRYDERGCGLSDWEIDDFSFEAWLRDLETVVAASGPERFALLGLSQGGPIALAYAVKYPERVSHLILYGSYALGKRQRNLTPEQGEELDTLQQLVRLGWGKKNPAFRQLFTSMFLPGGSKEQYESFNKLMQISSTPENAAHIIESLSHIDVVDLAKQVQVPTLVLHATGDGRIPVDQGKLLAALIPNARFVGLDSENHILLEHEPAWDRFQEEVHDFLRSESPQSERSSNSATVSAARADEREGHVPPPVTMTEGATETPAPPVPATPIVGRQTELARLEQAFAPDSDCRLLTLVGPGGMGKTRLALEGAQRLTHFRDGVAFVALAAVGNAEYVSTAVLESLGISLTGTAPVEQQLLSYLRTKEMLLVVDNFEQILTGADLLADILASAPQVHILATSRERLNLRGEWLLDVLGLPYPPEGAVKNLTEYGAVDLFLQSARQQTETDLVADPDEMAAVAAICRMVEGMPLALEMAAAWMPLLLPSEIVGEIEKNLDFLKQDARDTPRRHRSMRAVFSASWEQLSPSAQTVFNRLSVFRGGFSREAAQQIAEATLGSLAELVDKSLIQNEAVGRYAVHGLLGGFGFELLRENGTLIETKDRHFSYYFDFMTAAQPGLASTEAAHWLGEVDTEYENIRAAFVWSQENKGNNGPIRGLQLAQHLIQYWDSRELLHEAQTVLGGLLAIVEVSGPETMREKARGLDLARHVATYLGDMSAARHFCLQAVTLFKELKDDVGLAYALAGLGYLEHERGDYVEALAYAREALTLARQADEPLAVMRALNALGLTHMVQGDFAAARADFTEVLDTSLGLDDADGIWIMYYYLGRVSFLQGDLQAARNFARQSSALARKVGDPGHSGPIYTLLGEIALHEGEMDEARSYLAPLPARLRNLNYPQILAEALAQLATLALYDGDFGTAAACFSESLSLHCRLDRQLGQVEVLEGFGALAQAIGSRETLKASTFLPLSIRFYAVATAERARLKAPLPPVYEAGQRAVRTAVGTAVGEEHFTELWSESERLSFSETLDLALDFPDLFQMAMVAEHVRSGSEATPVVPSNLPAGLTPFYGRHTELAQIQTMLVNPECRLLTLTGPGGIGKTRLAQELGLGMRARARTVVGDGVWFVPLAHLRATADIVPAIVKAAGYDLYGPEQLPLEQLIDHMRDRQLLLILDNFEQWISAESRSLLTRLSAELPGVKLLITSRAPLAVPGEQLFSLAGLDLPLRGRIAREFQGLLDDDYGALQLFQDRARRVQPDFRLTDETLPRVTRICRLVEGMPLGIVLAASWLEMLSLAEIAAEIARSLDFLEAEGLGLPERQYSLRAVFESSWGYLDEAERAALAALTVFQDGCTLEAARELTGASLPVLLGLVQKSWLQRDEHERFHLHVLLRQYAAQKLAVDKEKRRHMRQRHAIYFAGHLRLLYEMMRGAEQQTAYQAVVADMSNVRAAWRWLVEHDQVATAVQELLPALHRTSEAQPAGGANLLPFLQEAKAQLSGETLSREETTLLATLLTAQSCFYRNGFPLRFALLGLIPPIDEVVIDQAWVLATSLPEAADMGFWGIYLAYSFGRQRDRQAGEQRLMTLVDQWRREERQWELALSIELLANLNQLHVDEVAHDNILARFSESLALFEEAGDQRESGYVLLGMGQQYRLRGEFTEAIRHWLAARKTLESVGDWIGANDIQMQLGDAYIQLGKFEDAFRHFRRASETYVARGNKAIAVAALSKESFESLRYGSSDHALRTREQCLAWSQEAGDWYSEAWSFWEMGEICRQRSELDQAREWYERAATFFVEYDDETGHVFYQRALGDLALATGAAEEAELHFRESAIVAEASGNAWAEIYAQTGLGKSLLRQNRSGAAAHLGRALRLTLKSNDQGIVMVALAGVMELLLAAAESERAAEVGTFVVAHFASWHETRRQATALLEEAAPDLLERLSEQIPARVPQLDARRLVLDLLDDIEELQQEIWLYNLPTDAVPFLGREVELSQIVEMLANPDCRLLTVVGLGGMGKSRLTVAAAERLWADRAFRHGVVFVPLAGLTTAVDMPVTIANGLNISLDGSAEPVELLLHHLQAREMLLLMDNVEHLLQGEQAAETTQIFNRLLNHCPHLKLLASSRETLQMAAEWQLNLDGLDYAGGAVALAEAPAVQLFVQAARLVEPAFALDEDNLAAVVRICELTAGMPLAINLAAAWLRTISLDRIITELESGLNILATRLRDTPARQRSIRAVFDYTWALLETDEQALWTGLSIFRGGFSEAAAAAVAGASPYLLLRLAERGLIQVVTLPGTTRYVMHELTRQYAAERLEDETLWLAHARYFADYVAARNEPLRQAGFNAAQLEIGTELNNISLAWNGLIALVSDVDATEQIVQPLHRFGPGLTYYFYLKGPLFTGQQMFLQAVEAMVTNGWQQLPDESDGRMLLALCQSWAARFCMATANNAHVDELMGEALPWLRTHGEVVELAHALTVQAKTTLLRGNRAQAKEELQESLALMREAADKNGEADVLNVLGVIQVDEGAYEEAIALYHEALATYSSIGFTPGEANVLHNIGTAYFKKSNYEAALTYYERSRDLARSIDFGRLLMWNIGSIGGIERVRGRYDRAAKAFRQSVRMAHELGEQRIASVQLSGLGMTYLEVQDYEAAELALLEGFRIGYRTENYPEALECSLILAQTWAHQGRVEDALKLASFLTLAEAARAEVQEKNEAFLAELADELPATAVTEAMAWAEDQDVDSVAGWILGS